MYKVNIKVHIRYTKGSDQINYTFTVLLMTPHPKEMIPPPTVKENNSMMSLMNMIGKLNFITRDHNNNITL